MFDRDFLKQALANMVGTLMAALVAFLAVWLSGVLKVHRADALQAVGYLGLIGSTIFSGVVIAVTLAQWRGLRWYDRTREERRQRI